MSNNNTIDYLKGKIRLLKSKKKTIVLITLIIVILAGIEAFTTINEYDTAMSVIPELPTEQGSVAGSLLKQFGGLSGLNIGGSLTSTTTIPPQLYSKVINSTPFLLFILKQEVYFKKYNNSFQIYDYFENHHRYPVISSTFRYFYDLPWKLLRKSSQIDLKGSLQKKNEPISLTKAQLKQIINLQNRITVTLDPETGILKLLVRMPDQFASAELSNIVLDYLKDYIITYRKEKAQQEFHFIESQLEEAKTKFEIAQTNLADFRDKNYFVSTAKLKIKEEKLLADYNLHFGVYSNLAQQFEQAKIKVNENTPIFKILEPAKIPIEKSTPHRLIILILSGLLGFLLSSGIVFIIPEIKSVIALYKS